MNAKRNAVSRALAVAGVVVIAMSGAVDASASTPPGHAGPTVAAHHVPAAGPIGGGIHLMCLACVE